MIICIIMLFIMFSGDVIAENKNDTIQMLPIIDTMTTKGITTLENSNSVATTEKQDSAYKNAIRLEIPFMTRFYNDFKKSDYIWNAWKQDMEETPWRNVIRSFENMPSDILKPESTELVQYQISRINALSVPGKPFFENTGIPLMNIVKDVGILLGILEDTTPEIKYTLSIITEVEIVIYSVQAKIIATIFKGTQKPGNYKITWNGRDETGKKMSTGDYIAEIRIGSEKFVRKRIVIK